MQEAVLDRTGGFESKIGLMRLLTSHTVGNEHGKKACEESEDERIA